MDIISKDMVLNGWAGRTREILNRNINYWFDFCSIYKIKTLVPNTTNIQRFISWSFSFSKASEASVSARITSIINYWKINGKNYDRRNNPIIRQQLNGYKRFRPPNKMIRKPWTIIMMKMAWKILKKNNFYTKLIKAILCIGYWHGARVGEYASTKKGIKLGDMPLKIADIDFLPSKGDPKQVTLTFRKSKSNQYGEKTERIASICRCPLPCSPCSLKDLIRAKKMRPGYSKNEVLLKDLKNKMLSPTNINNIIINLAKRMKINPQYYRSHSMRKGRTCDMVKEGFNKFQIKKFGRWRSDIWEEAYADFDYSDLSKIINKPIAMLGYDLK